MSTTADLADFALTLPAPAELRRRLQRIAALEAIASGADGDRYAFDADWKDVDGVTVALGTYDNGGGDYAHVVFDGEHTLIRAFDHQSPVSLYDEQLTWPGLLDGLPEALLPYVLEPQLNREEEHGLITLALWSGPGDTGWRHGRLEAHDGQDPEVTGWMLDDLAGSWENLAAVVELIGDDHGVNLDAAAGAAVLTGEAPISDATIATLVPDADAASVAEIKQALRTIGVSVEE